MHVFRKVFPLWQDLAGASIFITGGTGFFGKWLLESLLFARRTLALGCRVTVLSRNPEGFADSCPHLAGSDGVSLVRGDVRDFPFPEGEFPYVIHGAADVSAHRPPLELFSACLDGTTRVLDFARRASCSRFLLVSSGAVYGRQPEEVAAVCEGHPGGPDPLLPASAYGEGKRCAEWLAAACGREYGFDVTVARCFAFVGPYLPLDGHYAVGNFIRDAAAGKEIVIKGDGTPVRSYLYAADLAVWLWSILLRGRAGEAYNVGGEQSVTLAELARRVAALARTGKGTAILTPPRGVRRVERYLPDVGKARRDLGLRDWIPLDDALEKTLRWAKRCRGADGGSDEAI